MHANADVLCCCFSSSIEKDREIWHVHKMAPYEKDVTGNDRQKQNVGG
jgi:hypothetical protein